MRKSDLLKGLKKVTCRQQNEKEIQLGLNLLMRSIRALNLNAYLHIVISFNYFSLYSLDITFRVGTINTLIKSVKYN